MPITPETLAMKGEAAGRDRSAVFYSDKHLSGYVSCVISEGLLLGALASSFEVTDHVLLLLLVVPCLVIVLYVAVLTFFVLFSLPSMRYELQSDALYLILGPWKSRILYDSITDVVRKDLTLGLVSSFRLPGVAIFDVVYSDEGMVRMYSTHALKDVILIRTADGKKYGISPADPDGFLQALEQRKGKGPGK